MPLNIEEVGIEATLCSRPKLVSRKQLFLVLKGTGLDEWADSACLHMNEFSVLFDLNLGVHHEESTG